MRRSAADAAGRRRAARAAAALALAVVLAGCSSDEPLRPAPASCDPGDDLIRFHVRNPFPQSSVRIRSLADLARTVAFPVQRPTDRAAKLDRMFASADSRRVDVRAILVFDHEKFGQFYAEERAATVDLPDLAGAKAVRSTGPCDIEVRRVTLGSGVKGVLASGPRTTELQWTRAGVHINVVGPADTFDAKDAVAVGRAWTD